MKKFSLFPASPARRAIPNLTVLLCGLLLAFAPAAFAMRVGSFFDVFIENSSAPPFPSPPVLVNIGTPGVPFVVEDTVSMRLNSVMSPVGPPLGGQAFLQASDTGGGLGTAGDGAFFDVFLEVPGFQPASSFFDVFVEMAAPGGSPLPLTEKPVVTPRTQSFFDITYRIDSPGQGPQTVKLEFRVPEGQPVTFAGLPTIVGGTPGVDNSFTIQINVNSPVGWNPLQPVFRSVMTGGFGFWSTPVVPGTISKFSQYPDQSPRGLDVLSSPRAGFGTLLADDFICTRTGPISDIHVWGSWLNDQVDQPTFWLGIWSDVPATNNLPSHPGQLLWCEQYVPGQYSATLWRTVPFEQFYDPNPPAKILGTDRQIWKYDFWPRAPFQQLGSPQLPKVYWLSVGATNPSPQKLFGWKTTTTHCNDFAVFSRTQPVGSCPMPLQPWITLTNLEGQGKEFAFELTTANRWACNKDFWIPSVNSSHLRVVLPGMWPITGNFNGFGSPLSSFSGFSWGWDDNDNTVLDWTGGTVGQGEWVHVGFEGPGMFPPFLDWGWWNPFALTWWGWVPQVNIGWPQVLPALPVIGITNVVRPRPIGPGTSDDVFVTGLNIEYHTQALPLSALNRHVNRNPIRTDTIPVGHSPIPPGQSITAQIPAPPAEATYAVVIPQIAPAGTGPGGETIPLHQFLSVDYAMYPLTAPTPPAPPPMPKVLPPRLAAGEVILTWTAEPGAIYRVQQRESVATGGWMDLEGEVIATEATATKSVPFKGNSCFFQIIGMAP